MQKDLAACRGHGIAAWRLYWIANILSRRRIDAGKLAKPAVVKLRSAFERTEICDPDVVLAINSHTPRTVDAAPVKVADLRAVRRSKRVHEVVAL